MLKQAERMVKRSKITLAAGDVGDNVTIAIPLVDRGRGDPRNLMGVILNRNENDLYRSFCFIGTQYRCNIENEFNS